MSEKHHYFMVTFEGVRNTDNLVCDLESNVVGYEHITGDATWLLGCTTTNLKSPAEFESFSSAVSNIVHGSNCGLWCSVERKADADISHLL